MSPHRVSAKREAPVVWCLTDRKPGHESQLRGIGRRLQVLAGAELRWIPIDDHRVSIGRALFGLASRELKAAPSPDLILAAGTGTHRLLLSLRRLKGTRTIVLMRPSFPAWWVDGIIVPQHDGLSPGKHRLVTEGPVNSMTPLARVTEKKQALILIGGPSRHFHWDNAAVVEQVNELVRSHRDWRWIISDSRRTPSELSHELQGLASPRVQFVSHRDAHQHWLSHTLADCRFAWVTPDSASMVFESLTTGIPSGVLHLPPVSGSRIAAGINELVARKQVAEARSHTDTMTRKRPDMPVIWESDRAARWLIERFLRP